MQSSFLRRSLTRFTLLAIVLSLGAILGDSAFAQSAADRPHPDAVDRTRWMDRNASIDDRAEALLNEMTLSEKVGQMWQLNGIGGAPTGDADDMVAGSKLHDLIRQGQVGSILNEPNVATITALQRVAVNESRLGVPLIIGRDVIHGYRTIFPIPLGQAASWNPKLVEAAAAVAAREARSQGVHWTFAPMVDIARDPRWGRIAESLGEDPYLASAMSAAMVRGFQGNDLAAPDRVAACAKHFAGYGAAEGGRDYNTTVISPALLNNVYLPSFHAAVDADVATIMTAFNEINGVPCSANRYLLRDVLRQRWGFRGFVVSDWDAIEEMIRHGYSADSKAAALAAATADVNMEMYSPAYHEHLAELVAEGAIAESTIDALVLEILRVKFRLGLFERPSVDTAGPSPLLAEDHLRLARQLARQSVVLLKNDNAVLPLDRSKLKTLAVIGPLADAGRDQLGTWVPDGRAGDSQTPLAAIRQSADNAFEVLYVPALDSDLNLSGDALASAVDAARSADVVLLFVGETANLSGEARSRAILDSARIAKPAGRCDHRRRQTGGVDRHGRPAPNDRPTDRESRRRAVLVSCGHNGGAGHRGPGMGHRVALRKTTGHISQDGRPGAALLQSQKHGPAAASIRLCQGLAVDSKIDTQLGYNSNYIDVEPYPLFPFGYGLSYTTFQYGKTELSTAKLRAGQTLAVRVPVTNVGQVAATEVVQLYVRDLVGSITRPVRELKGFRRVSLKPGGTSIVEFALKSDDLAFFDNDEKRVLEPGECEIYVGGNSLAPLAGRFEVVD